MQRDDMAVVGGGVVGLATAWTLLRRRPGMRVVVLEKETAVAAHQTGRNSGVIHAGIYYKPGSLKATLCRRGKALLERFCEEHGVAHQRVGKLVVAVDEAEVARLDAIRERAIANGVACTRVEGDALREVEPHTAGRVGLHVPESGIVSYTDVCVALIRAIQAAGSEVRMGVEARSVRRDGETVVVETNREPVRAATVINCAGLHSDRVARRCGDEPGVRIVPFRGEYFELTETSRHLCRGLIYPVPDPSFPFLGVHFTRMIGGGVECGPNAVLSLRREGYSRVAFSPRDAFDTLTYGGFWRFAAKHWRTGFAEMARSFSKALFVRSLQRLVPEIRAEDIVPAAPGVRAQALAPEGKLVDDFVIRRDGPFVHVINAPSPAATACLAIAEVIADAALPGSREDAAGSAPGGAVSPPMTVQA